MCVQDYKVSSRGKRRVKTTGGGRQQGSSIAKDSESESDSSDSSDEEDDMDANSLSFRDGAGGLRAAMSHRKRVDKDRGSDEDSSDEDSSDNDSSDGETTGVSRKMADTYITESMSVTPASSVAVGSLMGRSLGHAMSSSFADDGLVWGGGGVSGISGIEDDAFFHENVSPSVSPPVAAAPISGRTEAASSRRTLF